jgi:predicted nucleic acid-binding protein
VKYLLGTCAISEVMKSAPTPWLLEWLSDQNEANPYLSALTFGAIAQRAASLY